MHRSVDKAGDAVLERHRGEIRIIGTRKGPRERPHDVEGLEPRHAVADLFRQQVGKQHPFAVEAAAIEVDESEDRPRQRGLGAGRLAEPERVAADRQGDPQRPGCGGVIGEDLPQPGQVDPDGRRPIRIERRRVDPEAFEGDAVLRDPPGAARDRFLEQVVQQLAQALGGDQRRMLSKLPEPRPKVGVAPPAAARRSLPGRCCGGLRIVPVLLRRGLRPHRDRNLQI